MRKGVEHILKSMKDLYTAAKAAYTGSPLIKEYTDLIDQYMESNPYEYFRNMQYILESSYGIKTLIPFMEKHGIPFHGIDSVKAEIVIQKHIQKQKNF